MKNLIKKLNDIKFALKRKGYFPLEGSASIEQINCIIRIIKKNKILNICEVGFNAGFSSFAFLASNISVKVTSFDIGEHGYIKFAKKIIDSKFHGRHKLILGDSKKSIPKFCKKNPKIRFDLIFIDGGHDYKTAQSDLINMKKLSTKETIVIMDDITPWLNWGKGPSRAWLELIKKGVISQDKLYKDGKIVNKIKPQGSRSWAIGKYIFK